MTAAKTITRFSPAKVNLVLAITGPREDGLHNLVSLVCPLDFGDTLTFSRVQGTDILECDDPTVPVGGDNLIIKALKAFRQQYPFEGGIHCSLSKRIPMGAGLGGGSSNAAISLQGVNELLDSPLSNDQLHALAASLGADCPLFLEPGPVVMRGFGQQIERAPQALHGQLQGRQVLLFKPSFSVNTGWAYSQMRQRGCDYISVAQAEVLIADWATTCPLYNNMESVIFEQYPSFQSLLESLRQEGIPCVMSGSGSSCFALLDSLPPEKIEALKRTIRDMWGVDTFMTVASLQS